MRKVGDIFLSDYLQYIGTIPLLDNEEVKRLAKIKDEGLEAEEFLKVKKKKLTDKRVSRKIRNKILAGHQAQDILFNSNLRLVVNFVAKYLKKKKHLCAISNLSYKDFLDAGNIGLWTAIRKYNWHLGFQLSTYANWWIRQKIQLAVNFEMKRDASLDDLLENGHYQQEDKKASKASHKVEHDLLREMLLVAISKLLPREQTIISLRFGLKDGIPHTLDEIANKLGITRERIRQIEARILKKLRKYKKLFKWQ